MEKDQFSNHLKKIIETSYSSFSLCKHYGSLSKRNVKECSKGIYSFKKQKQLLQAIRAELIRTGIMKTMKVSSPIELIKRAGGYSPQMFSAYQKLAEAKKNQLLLENPVIHEMTCLLEYSLMKEDHPLPQTRPSISMLENWLWDILK